MNPQRFPLGCWFLKPVRFYRFATEAYYFVALVGNDPTTFSMSRKRSPIELQGILELLTGNDPISLVYKTSASPLMLKKRIETPDGFEPTYHSFADWDLSHSDTVSFVVGLAGNDPTTSKVSASRSDHLSYSPI